MERNMYDKTKLTGWRLKLHIIIFESDTPAGKAFDVGLIIVIALSTLAVMLESVSSIRHEYSALIKTVEWGFTILFTIEYIFRIICVSRQTRYIFSFYGLVDLLAIAPNYLSVFFPGVHYLVTIRALRLLRVFRVLKLVLYLRESEIILKALISGRRKITIFIFAVITLVCLLGSSMYLIEGEASGFTSIPRSVYWAIVTLTTVGYGDIAPKTGLGQFLAAWVMILGYAIIAVPTGIFTAEIVGAAGQIDKTRICPSCQKSGHDYNAVHCKLCGEKL